VCAPYRAIQEMTGGDALDQAGVGFDVWRPPCETVGIEDSRGEQDGGLLQQGRVRLTPRMTRRARAAQTPRA
jgi:hypothetical protein